MRIRETRLTTALRREVRVLEAGAGWPVVLIHAFPLHAGMWRPQLERVPDGWRFVAADLPGFGGADLDAAQPPTMDEYAADVEAVLDALEIERAVIGGASMGGYATFALFRRVPERFSGMVLADTRATADSPEGRAARREMSELVRTRGVGAVADQMVPRLLGETTRAERPEVEAMVRRLIVENRPAGIDGAIHAMMTRPDSTPDSERISVPALIVVGAEDVLTPESDSRALHHAIRRSQLVVLDAAGHLPSLEVPEPFAHALAGFLSSNL